MAGLAVLTDKVRGLCRVSDKINQVNNMHRKMIFTVKQLLQEITEKISMETDRLSGGQVTVRLLTALTLKLKHFLSNN